MPKSEEMKVLVEVKGLKKSYGLRPILRGIDFVLRRGERMALLGANGVGKTTLLRLLAGLGRPSAGTICIEGLDSRYDAQQIRRLIGFVAHQPYLYEELTVLENLLFFARMYMVDSAHERARDLLEHIGLARRAQEQAGTLSRGQMQRLAWARALLHRPSLLLLDEPETGLDQEGHALIETLLVEHGEQGGSTLFTTHQLERALALSDSMVILQNGRIIYKHETKSLALHALQEVYDDFTGKGAR